MNDVIKGINCVAVAKKEIRSTIELSNGASFNIGDISTDQNSNQLKVTKNDDLIDATFSLDNKIEANENLVVRDLSKVSFIFCNHPLYPRKVDEDYEDEYEAARKDFACALFSYEDFMEGKLKLYGEDISGLAIYRGWMMKPEMYRDFYQALELRGIHLINTPEEYERYHLLPGWYEDFKDETALSLWTKGNNLEDVIHISEALDGAYIVKDYVKSRKHEWYDACFIKNIQDKGNLETVVNNFITRQGDNLVGGVVLRKFETLKSIGYHQQSGMPLSEEYRVFVYANKILAIDDYWMKKANINITLEEYQWIESIASKINSIFVTIDIARKEDGKLMIMELGDGQVSGLQQLEPTTFYQAFQSKTR